MTRSFRAVAVQPKWQASDFVSAPAFRRWMHNQLEMARPHLAPDRPNLVVLTELNGLPLVLRGGGWALRFRTFQRVALALFLARLTHTLPVLLREKVSPVRALQLASAEANAQLYLQTCQQLAREYGVYLCCGSTPMPRFYLSQSQLRRRPGILTNQSVIFDPRGHLIGTADKVHLTPDEEAGGVDLSSGDLSKLRVFPTPVGDLGVAISLDAFRADVIGSLEAQSCTVLLQPDANGAPWTAKEGLPPDPQKPPRDQPLAWLESSWTVTSTSPVIRYAINPMVVGNLLDLTFDGQSAITGHPNASTTLQSYVMTAPRPGFLALAPWAMPDDGARPETEAKLRQIGLELAAHSGHPRENAYLQTVLYANLELPASQLPTPEPTEHEVALRAWLDNPAMPPKTAPARLSGYLLGLVALAAGLGLWWAKRPKR